MRVLSPDIVLLNEDVILKETYAGQDISGPYRMTTIWAKRSGKWRLVFEQEIAVALQGIGRKLVHDVPNNAFQ